MKTFITETKIKLALEQKLITRQEARKMLLAYIGRENFTPIVHKTVKLHRVA